MFVQIVVGNFNTLYLGNVENGKQSYVLVVYDVPMSKAAAITMEYHPDGCYWLVRTAFPIRAAEIRNHPEKIIWTKERVSHKFWGTLFFLQKVAVLFCHVGYFSYLCICKSI